MLSLVELVINSVAKANSVIILSLIFWFILLTITLKSPTLFWSNLQRYGLMKKSLFVDYINLRTLIGITGLDHR